MTVTTQGPFIIPMSWQEYLAGTFDPAQIPWERYRYSGIGVVPVSPEVIRNLRIARQLAKWVEAESVRLNNGWEVYLNGLGVEVERSQKEERIPDLMVISRECDLLLSDLDRVVTREMPAPILVVEVVSPSSKRDDLNDKPFEYMERGVGEYVSIDWRSPLVTVWSRKDGSSYNYCEYRRLDELVSLESFPNLTFTVQQMILG